MRLRVLVGGGGLHQLLFPVVDIEVTLARPIDAIGPVEAGVEPLRAVGRAHLHGEHVAVLVVEGAGIGLRREVAALPAPIGPGAGEAIEDLAGIRLAADARLRVEGRERALIGGRAPEPGGNRILFDAAQLRRHAGLAEILLRQDVGGNGTPMRGHREILEAEDDRAVRIFDFARRLAERDLVVGRFARLGEVPRNAHLIIPFARGLPKPAPVCCCFSQSPSSAGRALKAPPPPRVTQRTLRLELDLAPTRGASDRTTGAGPAQDRPGFAKEAVRPAKCWKRRRPKSGTRTAKRQQ